MGKEMETERNIIIEKISFEGEYKNGLKWNVKGYDNNNK